MDKFDIYMVSTIVGGAIIGGMLFDEEEMGVSLSTLFGSVIGSVSGPFFPVLLPGIIYKRYKRACKREPR